ncbi:hypothetical protein ILUMI_16425 [Ignelater luminosus]|uniref:Transposase Tc1-like domain-containing protein n=1 Tax=Ignelater luminosus TaxID=2038154 RepID=A0A8K0CLU1_IGNLU|nr:hypothetical protein ILUMI_16425 [Ignelater luminosus]
MEEVFDMYLTRLDFRDLYRETFFSTDALVQEERDLQHPLRRARQVNVSVSTIKTRLYETNLSARRLLKGPELLPYYRQTRLEFARNHIDWTEENVAHVLFTDESKFNLWFSDGLLRVWRRRNERYAACTFSSKVPFGGREILVALTAAIYIEDILLLHVVPYGPFIGNNFILIQDKHVQKLLELSVNFLTKLKLGPKPYSIEHVWDVLGRQIRNRQPPSETLNDLRIALTEEWNNIPQKDIRHLITNMNCRLSEVLRARGGNTRLLKDCFCLFKLKS